MKNFAPKVSLKQLRTVKGTNYQKKTTSRKHVVILDCQPFYLSNPLVTGNSKLDKGILIFDLPAVISCYNCRSCRNQCYALKAQRQYPATFNKRLFNLMLVLNDIYTLEKMIVKQLRTCRKRIVRIHSSGDFVSQRYLNMWASIANQFPKIQFYTYTKVDKFLDFSPLDRLPNVNVIRSILPDGSNNFGDKDTIDLLAYAFKYPVCPYGTDAETHCGTECQLCMTKGNEHVLFYEH